jgi:hypothetical protein
MTYNPRPEDIREVPPEYDLRIKNALAVLTDKELETLAEQSNTTANSGYLMSHTYPNTRDDYINEISEITDKEEWQINLIRKKLNIDK